MVKEVILNEEIKFGGNNRFVLLAGPCMLENEKIVMETAEKIKEITTKLNVPFVFKGSFDKANRSSIYSHRGPGIEKGLELLAKVKETFNVPVVSDIHESYQAELAGQVL